LANAAATTANDAARRASQDVQRFYEAFVAAERALIAKAGE
jgi:hypothetical protein